MSCVKRRSVRGTQGSLEAFEAGEGSGLPLLFLHADSGNAGQWRPTQQRLAAERRAVAFDFRGHGWSEPAANEDYGYAGRAEDVASVAEALDLRRFVIVAHSGSAGAALEYAASNARRVAGLLLVDPPADPRAMPRDVRDGMLEDLAGQHSLEVQKAFYTQLAGPNPAVRERVIADCELVSQQARYGVAHALARWNPERTLKAWRGPIQILSSAANDNGHALYDLRPDITHVVVPDVGHWIQLEQPELVEQAIRGLVAAAERELR